MTPLAPVYVSPPPGPRFRLHGVETDPLSTKLWHAPQVWYYVTIILHGTGQGHLPAPPATSHSSVLLHRKGQGSGAVVQ